jgi:hypothetical protein
MRRRQFLAFTLGGGAAGLLLVFVHPNRRRESVVLELESLLDDVLSAVAIGKAYLLQTPAENSVQVLGDRLFGDIRWAVLFHSDLRSVLADRVRRDFRDGRIVRLRSWGLALTEARLCALVALTKEA